MHIALVVLKSADIDGLSRFYDSVGIPMLREQHGDGPAHYAGPIGLCVLEIYPAKQATKTTFGIAVESVSDFKSAWLSAGGRVSNTGAMLLDPDGNALIVSEATPN
jgi:lactoylglutathione lyase